MTVPAWPFKPDWSEPILETFEWLTSVLTSRSGAEQRMAQRITPRRVIDYPVQLYGNERALFDIWMMKNNGMPWYVPIPSEGFSCRVSLAAGDTRIDIGMSYREQSFPVGTKVVVQGDVFTCEVVQVTASTDATGFSVSPLTKNYPNGATVSPAVIAQITDTVSMSRKSGAFYSGTVRFTALQANKRIVSTAPLPTYQGFPVLTIKPNSVNDIEYTYERTLFTVDNKTSIPRYQDPRGFASMTQKFDFFLYGARERSNFLDLLYTLQGQLMPVWVPTFNDDLAPGAGWTDPDGYLGSVPLRTKAIEFLRDGTFNIRAAASTGSAVSDLFANKPILQTCFLSLKRLGIDSVEVSHHARAEGVATSSVLFRDAPDIRVAGSYFKNPFNTAGDPAPAVYNPPLDMVNPVVVSGPSEDV